MEDLVVAGHRTQIITCSSSRRRRNRRTSSPSNARSLEFAPTRRRHRRRLRRSPNITNPLIDDPEPNRAPRTTITAPACGPTTPASFTAPPAPPYPRRGGETPAKLFPLLFDAIPQRLSFVLVFQSPLDFVFDLAGDLPNSAWKSFSLEGELSSASDSSPEGRYLLLKTGVMVLVLVALVLVAVFVLRCRVGQFCSVDG